jgi:hypothetical protein
MSVHVVGWNREPYLWSVYSKFEHKKKCKLGKVEKERQKSGKEIGHRQWHYEVRWRWIWNGDFDIHLKPSHSLEAISIHGNVPRRLHRHRRLHSKGNHSLEATSAHEDASAHSFQG